MMDYSNKQVEIFTHDTACVLQNVINEFLQTHKVVDIQFRTIPAGNYDVDYSAMITYEKTADSGDKNQS